MNDRGQLEICNQKILSLAENMYLELGSGFKEDTYQKALAISFRHPPCSPMNSTQFRSSQPEQHIDPVDVITMFMGQQNAVQLPGLYPQSCHALHDLPRTQPGINQHMRGTTAYQRGIATTATAEHSHVESAPINNRAVVKLVSCTYR